MKTATVTLSSMAPYSQSKYFVPHKERGEGPADFETRTWRQRLHVTEDGHVFIPPMSFKNCLSEIAKYLAVSIPGRGKATFTKHFEAGVMVIDGLTLPYKAADVPGEWFHVPSDGKRGGTKRVLKCFPVISKWAGQVQYHILDETVLTTIDTPEGQMTAFEWHLRQAGAFIGIGRFRPRNNGFYGRFKVEKIEWI